MLVGGALVNAVAFSELNWLFLMLRVSGVNEERKRHNKAIEELQVAQAEWSQKWTESLDFINEELHWQSHVVQTFRDIKAAIRQYSQATWQNIDPLGPEPQLSDFYYSSDDQKYAR